MSFDLNKNSNNSENEKGFSLEKKDELNSKPLKKDLNLKKTTEESKAGLNLTKEKLETEPKTSATENQSEPKKKSPLMLITIIAIAALGIFWYVNRGNDESPVTPVEDASTTVVNDTVSPQTEVTSDTVQTEQPIATSSTTQEEPTNAEPVNSTNANTKINKNSSVSKNNDSFNSSNQGTIEEMAKQVMDGVFGNGEDRKNALGAEYDAIQAKVNEMYRNKR